jgi:hypothetical protein
MREREGRKKLSVRKPHTVVAKVVSLALSRSQGKGAQRNAHPLLELAWDALHQEQE